jgi:glycosyltransferase involved in cell wall biosynthesis
VDWVAPVGVDVEALPPFDASLASPGRVFSARREAAIYRREWIREAVAGIPDATLVDADDWPEARMAPEYLRAHVVVSVPRTDGAPATVMEALCCGAHVVASGGATIKEWTRAYGGTYGDPESVEEVRTLIRHGLEAASSESVDVRGRRAMRAREAFHRDTCLKPLLGWITQGRVT